MEQKAETIVKTQCGGILTEPEKYPSADYQGQRVYFCNQACLRAFMDNPDGFMSGEIEHPLDEEI
ncbi:MAG: YHS domain-containing protein [Chloroflexi bacterium]|nr:YHS domain-containing protein [Chloroflexota bacterium]